MIEPVIEVRALTKSYPPNDVLRGVDLTVQTGEWVALMGPSGCGKSTLLNLIAGLDDLDTGSISLAGQQVECLRASARAKMRRRHVGILFQAFNLVPHLDVRSNVELPLRLAGASKGAAAQRCDELLERLGLLDHHRASPSTLSGGQQQRVALARAIANAPSVLLADEPTGSLDSAATASVLELLRAEHHRGQTIVMVTHDYLVASAADRIVRMRDGRCVGSENLLDELNGGFVDDLVGSTTESAFDRLVRFE
jgi:putative ABC transport system ATP-binding protein